MQASQEGHVDVVNVLLDHGANANHQTDVSGFFFIHYLSNTFTMLHLDLLVCSDGSC